MRAFVPSHFVYSCPSMRGPQLVETLSLYAPSVPCPNSFWSLGLMKRRSTPTEEEMVTPSPLFLRPLFVMIWMTPLPAREP